MRNSMHIIALPIAHASQHPRDRYIIPLPIYVLHVTRPSCVSSQMENMAIARKTPKRLGREARNER